MKANCPIRSAFSARVTISCESRVQNHTFLLSYKEVSRFPVYQRTCKPSAMANYACINLQIAEAQPVLSKERASRVQWQIMLA